MINSITITNHLGESTTIELRFPEKSGFLVRGPIDGLGPPKAAINVSEMATDDGSVVNSTHVNTRNIVFQLGFLENPTIERTRRLSYKYFPLKKRIRMVVESDERIAEIYGNVESNTPDIFSSSEGSVISVLCPKPYLYSLETQVTEFSGVESLFEFPFSNEHLTENLIIMGSIQQLTSKYIYYTGEAPIGIVIIVHAIGPADGLTIINERTSGEITIDTDKFSDITGSVDNGILAGDVIRISTIKGSKSITLQRDGEFYNIINCLGKYPEWFQLEPGDNLFGYTSVDGLENLDFRIENQIAYEGI